MPPEVLQAFLDGAKEWVSLEQLQAAASRKIAAATGTQAGLVTCGSAAALTLGAAAIMCRFDLGRMERLPHCEEFSHEFVIAREQRSGYDHAIRASGARLVEVGFNEIVSNAGVRRTEVWEYEAAFGPNTAGIVYGHAADSQPDLRELVELAHRHDFPILIDAAGELPPTSNLTAIPATGADLIAFSGGKAIRGPQATGILCGRGDLIASAALQLLDMDDHFELWDPPADFIDKSKLSGIPRHGIGRAMKVSKEEIAALLTAVDLFTSGKYTEQLSDQRDLLNSIASALAVSPAECQIVESAAGERLVLEVTLDEAQLGLSAMEVCRRLRNGSPPIYVAHGGLAFGQLIVNPMCLDQSSAETLAIRLGEELTGA